MIHGHARAVEQFASAWHSRATASRWLLAGPRGVGKAAFAHAAVRRILAEAAGPPVDLPGLETPGRSSDRPPARRRQPSRLPIPRKARKPKTGLLSRNISVDQVRALGPLFGSTPFMSAWRAVVIDSADDLEALRRQRLAQDARGAAGQLPVPARQPHAGRLAADDPLALPQARLRALGRCRHDVSFGGAAPLGRRRGTRPA